jgi:hypothetical protein
MSLTHVFYISNREHGAIEEEEDPEAIDDKAEQDQSDSDLLKVI